MSSMPTVIARALRLSTSVFLLCSGLMFSSLATAQNPGQSLLRQNQTLPLPTTVGQLKTALGRAYNAFEKEDFDTKPGGWGNRYVWQVDNGLVVTAQSDGQTSRASDSDAVRAFFLTAPSGRTVPALRGLVLNKSTKAGCQARFKSALKPARAAVLKGQRAWVVQADDACLYLIFNSKGILITLWQTNFDLETAG